MKRKEDRTINQNLEQSMEIFVEFMKQSSERYYLLGYKMNNVMKHNHYHSDKIK